MHVLDTSLQDTKLIDSMCGKAQHAIERARGILMGLTYGDLAAHPEIYGLPLHAIPKTCFSFMSLLHVRWAEQAGWRPSVDPVLLNYGSDGDKRQLVEEWVSRSVQTVAETPPSSPPAGERDDGSGSSSSVREPLAPGRRRGRRRGGRHKNRRRGAGGSGLAGA